MLRLPVSIVTVCRNSEKFLEETIQSVLSQDYDCIEYIVIDGGSTDGTVDIIQRYDSNIDHWVSEPDRGISDAFNKGVASSSGEYILFLNSDDRLHASDVISKIISHIVCCDYPMAIYGDCNVLSRNTGKLRYRAIIEYKPSTFLKGRTLPHPSLFLHRSYFDRYGLFDEAFTIAMDYELLLRGIPHERVVHVPCLVTDVRDGGCSTKDYSQAVEEIILALKKNRYVHSIADELGLRLYYGLRGVVRRFIGNYGGDKSWGWLRR